MKSEITIRIKICGIKDRQSALDSIEAGADFLGIIFEPDSKRYLPVEEARRLVRSLRVQDSQERPRWVGVFANQPLEEVNHVLEHCGLDMAQLSGHESLEYCRQVIRPVVKVFQVRDDKPQQEVLERVERSLCAYQEDGHMCQLDTFKQGILGGTGQAFDWEVAQSHSFLLAGGLSPENVSEAIRQVRPWGVDVSHRCGDRGREGHGEDRQVHSPGATGRRGSSP